MRAVNQRNRIRDLEREIEVLRQRLDEQGRILSAVCAEGRAIEAREYESERPKRPN